jgi:protein involved in sex pheromone biosynthesis
MCLAAWILCIWLLERNFYKKTVTGWQNINGILVEYTKTYTYYYETDSGTVYFNLISGLFVLQFLFGWL